MWRSRPAAANQTVNQDAGSADSNALGATRVSARDPMQPGDRREGSYLAATGGSSASSSAIDLSAFARLYEMRAPRIAWLFGAGASAAAGVPTAYQAIWDWKARIYATEKNIRLSALDLADPLVLDRIQRHFDLGQGNPAREAEEEYSFYFERAYPRAEDRRTYLDQLTDDAKPGFGHLGLGALMSLNKVGVIWTTNFDRLIEDAAASVLGTTRRLTTATIGDPSIAIEALRDERFPLLVKLHGDFQSERLKNTRQELQDQDATLREALRRAATRYGLAVVGYSGRDASVMEAIHAGLDELGAFAAGLYWFARGTDTPLPTVEALLDEARAKGVDAYLIRFDSFDDLVGRLLALYVLPRDIDGMLAKAKPPARLSPFDLSARSPGRFPVLRFNALHVETYPKTARRVGVPPTVGGTRDVKDLVRAAGVPVIAHRRQDGIVAFGTDDEIRRAFASVGVTDWDLAPINPLAGSPTDIALLYDTITRAIARRSPLIEHRHALSVDPARASDPAFAALRAAAGSMTGTIPGTSLIWAEGVEISLEARLGNLWLVFEPTIWADLPPRPATGAPAPERAAHDKLRFTRAEFIRSRLAPRYNKNANAFFKAWADILAAGGIVSGALGIAPGTGIEAEFAINATTAYSRAGA